MNKMKTPDKIIKKILSDKTSMNKPMGWALAKKDAEDTAAMYKDLGLKHTSVVKAKDQKGYYTYAGNRKLKTRKQQ